MGRYNIIIGSSGAIGAQLNYILSRQLHIPEDPISMLVSSSDTAFLSALSGDSSDKELLSVIDLVRSKYSANMNAAATLARVIAASGTTLDVNNDFVADVASTGGPSSLSTLLTPLFLREAGASVPKLGVSGRPAGGIDCLAQIPGYRISLTRDEVMSILDSGGYAHFLADREIAPLDGRLFKLRQANGAQNVPSLLTASLLSKKIVVGVRDVGLDVRVAPHGNFGTEWPSATANAKLFIETARLLSVKAHPVLTDARYPYQPYIGRREGLVALHDLFCAVESIWLKEHFLMCRALALACTPDARRLRIVNVSRHDLRQHFDRNLRDQGAHPEKFDAVVDTTKKLHVHEVRAEKSGFAVYPLESIRNAIVFYQNRITASDNPFPDPVGIILYCKPGSWVNKGEVLATVRTSDGITDEVLRELRGLIATPSANPIGLGMEAIT